MSKTISKIIQESLVAKFYVHPVPQSLAQSTAICQYFQALNPANKLIQYRHARDPATGTRLNSFRIIFRDPPKASSGNTGRLVTQVPFHKRASQFQAQAKVHRSATRTTTAKQILKSIPAFMYTPRDAPSQPAPHSALIVSTEPPAGLELKLLETTQIILDSETNQVIPLEEYLDRKYIHGTNHDEKDADTGYIKFTLDLALMSRDPNVITYASKNSLLDHFKIDRKQDFSQRLKALDRLKNQAMHGFTGKFQ